MKPRQLLSSLSGILLGLALAACQPEADSKEQKNNKNVAMVMVDGVNYQHELGVRYTLYDLSQNPPLAIGGGIIDPLAGVGAKGCCVALPKKWRPGLKVRVAWEEADHDQTFPEKTIDLEIPRYDEPADLYVVFYWNHEVEVVVSPADPGHPLWTGKIKQPPWDYCVAKNGHKPCWLAIPKPGLDLDELNGYCTYLKQEGKDMKSCDIALRECNYNYEDEELCKKTVWAPYSKEKERERLK